MGFLAPSTSRDVSSDQHRVFLARLCSAFRFSRPLDALLRSRPLGLVSCRFRPWGSCSQRFPPSGSCHGFFFTARPPSVIARAAVASPRRFFRTDPASRRRHRSTRPGIRASGRSVHGGGGVTRSPPADPLSAFGAPSRISPLESRRHFHAADFHGLSRRAGSLHRDDRSPKCQRTRRSACLFRVLPPSLGFAS